MLHHPHSKSPTFSNLLHNGKGTPNHSGRIAVSTLESAPAPNRYPTPWRSCGMFDFLTKDERLITSFGPSSFDRTSSEDKTKGLQSRSKDTQTKDLVADCSYLHKMGTRRNAGQGSSRALVEKMAEWERTPLETEHPSPLPPSRPPYPESTNTKADPIKALLPSAGISCRRTMWYFLPQCARLIRFSHTGNERSYR